MPYTEKRTALSPNKIEQTYYVPVNAQKTMRFYHKVKKHLLHINIQFCLA